MIFFEKMKHQRTENYPARNLSTFFREEKKPSMGVPQKLNETLLRIIEATANDGGKKKRE